MNFAQIPLEAALSIFKLYFFLKTFFGKELLETKEIGINNKSSAF